MAALLQDCGYVLTAGSVAEGLDLAKEITDLTSSTCCRTDRCGTLPETARDEPQHSDFVLLGLRRRGRSPERVAGLRRRLPQEAGLHRRYPGHNRQAPRRGCGARISASDAYGSHVFGATPDRAATGLRDHNALFTRRRKWKGSRYCKKAGQRPRLSGIFLLFLISRQSSTKR